MPKNTTKKNTKGTKSTTSKKVETKKTPVKKVEAKVTEKKVKEVVKEKKGNKLITKVKAIVAKVMENTPLVIALCVIVVLLAALIFTLCTKRVPKTSEGNEVLATVNGKTITADELYESLKETYGTDSLINLIDKYIADKEVEITKDNEAYVQEVVDYYKDYAEYYGVDLATFLSSYVGLTGITTEEEFYNYVLEDYKKTLVVTNYIGENATEEELKEFYEENYSDKLTVKHILIEIDAEAKDKDKADKEAYEKALDIIEELNETSSKKLDSKFEELAEDNSDDTATYSNGGLIEKFAKADVEKEFWNASEKLEDGKYTKKPIKTSYGYHVILKVSTTPVEKYKDIKDEVKGAYAESLLTKDSTLLVKKWDELRKQYKLSIKDDFIKETYEKTIKEAIDANEKTEE